MAELRWTKARRSMLEQVASDPGRYEPGYPPLKWLTVHGLVERTTHGHMFRITPEGRAALRAREEG